ncbi:family 16 glycosylhydrolase [Saccharopolyspora erythraea]|nr:family 16 glycosylhydrolase [Saccharopolyspora erythraea]
MRTDGRGALAIDLGRLGPAEYSGGRIDSQGKFDYTRGSIEFRAHVPPTEGHLAAVWLQADSPGDELGTAADGAEVDVLESAHQSDTYPVTLHYDGYGEHHQSSSEAVRAPGLHGTWYHTFGLEWSESSLRFRYDGQVVREVTDPKLISRVAEFPIISHEILEFTDGDVTKAPLDHTSTMYVGYVRVWQG